MPVGGHHPTPRKPPRMPGEAYEALQPLAPPSTTCALPLLSAIQQEVGAAPSGGASCNTCNTSAWGKYDRHSSPLTPSPPPRHHFCPPTSPPSIRRWEHRRCVGLEAPSDSRRTTAGIERGFPGCAVPIKSCIAVVHTVLLSCHYLTRCQTSCATGRWQTATGRVALNSKSGNGG